MSNYTSTTEAQFVMHTLPQSNSIGSSTAAEAQSVLTTSQLLQSSNFVLTEYPVVDLTAASEVFTESANYGVVVDGSPAALKESVNNKMTVDEIVTQTVDFCTRYGVENPVEVLRYFPKYIVKGRPFEVEDGTMSLEGETHFILVDGNNLMETSFDEIDAITDYRSTLEVQFYDEVGKSSGLV